MLCPRCGSPFQKNETACSVCGCPVDFEETAKAVSETGSVRKAGISNYLWFSICMLVICLPMGAAALVYSVRAERYIMLRDYRAAREASFKARKINMLGLAIMAIAAAVYFLFMIIVMLVVK